jgi:hypothetical protein
VRNRLRSPAFAIVTPVPTQTGPDPRDTPCTGWGLFFESEFVRLTIAAHVLADKFAALRLVRSWRMVCGLDGGGDFNPC